MWILKDNLQPKLYYKGNDNSYGRHSYTYKMKDALRFTNEDEARHIAEELNADIIKIKE